MSSAFAKSMVTSAVMSAAENRSPGDEGHLFEPPVRISEKVLHAQHAAVDQSRDLLIAVRSGDGAAVQPLGFIAHAFHHRRKAFQLSEPLPHDDQALVLGRSAQQGRSGKGFIEIPHDGRHLCDGGAISEHQGWHHAAGIDCPLGFRVLLARAEIDRNQRRLEPFLGQENSDTPRIGRADGVVEFQLV